MSTLRPTKMRRTRYPKYVAETAENLFISGIEKKRIFERKKKLRKNSNHRNIIFLLLSRIIPFLPYSFFLYVFIHLVICFTISLKQFINIKDYVISKWNIIFKCSNKYHLSFSRDQIWWGKTQQIAIMPLEKKVQ